MKTHDNHPRCGSCRWFNPESVGSRGNIGKCEQPASGCFKVCDRTIACDLLVVGNRKDGST